MWKAQQIYKNNAFFEKDLKALKKYIKDFSLIKEDINTSKSLLNVLSKEEKIDYTMNKFYTFFMIKSETGHSDAYIKSKEIEVDNLMSLYYMSYIDFEKKFLSLSESKKKRLLNTKLLSKYHPRLKKLIDGRSKSSKSSRKILSMFESIVDTVPSIYSNILNKHLYFQDIKIQGTKIPINSKNLQKLESSPNRKIRKATYNSYRKALNSTSDSYIKNLNSFLQYKLIEFKSEKGNSFIEHCLASDGIKDKQINSLLNTSLKNKEVIKKYVNLIKKEYKIQKPYSYDLNVDDKMKFNSKELFSQIYDAFYAFENSSINIIKNLEKNNYIHVEQNPKKLAYHSGYSICYDVTKEPYVYCYDKKDIDTAATLAHELGHAVHQVYLNKNNDLWNRDTSFIIHETISHTHELVFLLNLLNNKTNKNHKKGILLQIIKTYYYFLYKKSFETKFEKFLYKQKENLTPLVTKNVSKKYEEFFDNYFEGIINKTPLTHSDWIGEEKYTWDFYSLKYLIAFAFASKISFEIFHGNDEYIKNFNKMMTLGETVATKDFFSLFNLKFNKLDDLLEEAYEQMNSLIDEYYKI